MKRAYIAGVLFAVGAALCNGSIGVFSKSIFSMASLSPAALSFYKCFIAFIVVSVLIVFNKRSREEIAKMKRKLKEIILCAFLGIFVLYFFETTGYKYAIVPIVVFILLGTSALITFVFGTWLLIEKKNRNQFMGLFLLIAGLAVTFIQGVSRSDFSIGWILAAVAGAGYGLFLVLTRRFQLVGGLPLVWYLMGFASLYLFIPFAIQGITLPSLKSIPELVALAILPTIGGFYCTTKALTLIAASKVQLFELTEPLFATLFAYVFLGETIRGMTWLGSGLILLAIYICEHKGSRTATELPVVNCEVSDL